MPGAGAAVISSAVAAPRDLITAAACLGGRLVSTVEHGGTSGVARCQPLDVPPSSARCHNSRIRPFRPRVLLPTSSNPGRCHVAFGYVVSRLTRTRASPCRPRRTPPAGFDFGGSRQNSRYALRTDGAATRLHAENTRRCSESTGTSRGAGPLWLKPTGLHPISRMPFSLSPRRAPRLPPLKDSHFHLSRCCM